MAEHSLTATLQQLWENLRSPYYSGLPALQKITAGLSLFRFCCILMLQVLLPAELPSVGHRAGTEPPCVPGQDRPADHDTHPPMPSPGWAAHPLLQYTACSFAIGLFHLDSQTTRFTSYESPNIIWVLMGNTANTQQKLFSSKQQITRVEKNLRSG